MPIIKSAKKRVRVARKAAVRNARSRRNLKSALKVFGGKPSVAAHSAAQSQIDKALKKHVIHKNKAARLKRRAAARAKAAGVKPGKTVAKTITKKAAQAKKATPAKKTAVKKPVVNKK
jgi:small subunit ribosomal protein S20